MVKLKKSGLWALEGVHVVEMVAGTEESYGPSEDFKLVQSGWAEWVPVKAAEPVKESVSEEPRRPGRPRQDR